MISVTAEKPLLGLETLLIVSPSPPGNRAESQRCSSLVASGESGSSAVTLSATSQ
jgi:hypothetical protein